MKTYQKSDFSNAQNMPKGFPSQTDALTAAEVAAPGMKVTLKEESWGWIARIYDGEASEGNIVQNGLVHWVFGDRCREQIRENARRNRPLWGKR